MWALVSGQTGQGSDGIAIWAGTTWKAGGSGYWRVSGAARASMSLSELSQLWTGL